jgi:drug/metabolite transporter (DMT)-like permease
MSWIILTLLAITARATYSIATKVLSKDVEVSAITHSVLLTTVAGVLSLVIAPFVGGISFTGIEQYWFPVILMIASQTFGNVLFFQGVKKLDAGTAQIAFSSILIWGAILSVFFLDSVFSVKQFMGILIMLGAILLVQYKGKKFDVSSGVLYIIGSAVLFAIFQVASADISKVISTGAYLLMAYLGPSLIIGIIYLSQLKKDLPLVQKQLKNTSIKTLFASGTSLLYFVFSYLAYQQSSDSGVVVVLLTAQVVLSVIFGILFLKEKDNQTRKLLAGALAFAAGALIKG